MSAAARRLSLVLALSLLLVASAIPTHASWTCSYEICYEDPPPPPEPGDDCGQQCIPGVHTQVDIGGIVTNTLGVPIRYAGVYWTYGSTTTDFYGSYRLRVWADNPVTLTADHSQYQRKSEDINFPMLAAATGQNFQLPFLVTATTTPSAFNGSTAHSLVVRSYTTAPTTGVRVVMQDASAAAADLAYDGSYTNPDGWSRWTGTLSVPAGTSDGRACHDQWFGPVRHRDGSCPRHPHGQGAGARPGWERDGEQVPFHGGHL